jgi:hypothetical protein
MQFFFLIGRYLKKSSPVKLLSHMNWNLVGSIYMYGRFCIKFQIVVRQKDHGIWPWKSRYWLGTCIQFVRINKSFDTKISLNAEMVLHNNISNNIKLQGTYIVYTDKLYHIMLYTSPWSRFELTTSVVIGTYYIGSCKSNYQTITATTAPSLLNKFSFPYFQFWWCLGEYHVPWVDQSFY